jgi:hypothetical protein
MRRMNRICGLILLSCVLIGCANPEEKARTLLNQAHALERKGKDDEARKLMEQVVKQYPQTTAAAEANQVLSVQSIFLSALSPAQMQANERSAYATVSSLGRAQLLYRSDKKEFGTLKQLGDDELISAQVASGLKSGYRFETQPGKDKTSEFTVTGSPVELGKTGTKFFFVDATQVIRCSSAGPATSGSDPCG